MKRTIAALCLCFLAGFPGLSDASTEWRLIKENAGIRVFERKVEGTDLREFVGVTVIDEKMEILGEILRDVSSFPEWITDCHIARMEKKYDRNTMVIYMVLKPPIIEERDIILKNSTVYDWDNGRAVIAFTVTDEVAIPPEKGRVRIPLMEGAFEMEYLGRDRTKFIYRLKVDPAGAIPKRVAYAVMSTYPFTSLRDLKKMAGRKKYADAAVGTEEKRAIETRTGSEAYVRGLMTSRLTRYAKNKAALRAIIDADREHVKGIVDSGGTYASVEGASVALYIAYLEGIIDDRARFERLRTNWKMIDEITGMITTDCGADAKTVEAVVAKYR